MSPLTMFGPLISLLQKLCKSSSQALLLWLILTGIAFATPPEVGLRVPVTGTSIPTISTTAVVAFEGVVHSFNSGGTRAVELWEGGTLLGSTPPKAALASYTFSYSFPIGGHRVEMRGTDAHGLTNSSFVDFTVIPAVAPTVTMTSPKEGE